MIMMAPEPTRESLMLTSLVVFNVFDFLLADKIVTLKQLSKEFSTYYIPNFCKWSQRKILKKDTLKPDHSVMGIVFESCKMLFKLNHKVLKWEDGEELVWADQQRRMFPSQWAKFCFLKESNKMIYTGGYFSKLNEFSHETHIVELDTSKIWKKADMLGPRSNHGICRIQDTIYCAGGNSKS